ncbi:F0F1 ATP synthase subunit B [Prochlorothrix hollandica]|uniref:ATP synthase subunit b n=1 Tax=Prochlorothrix hollandica PCC 9006 = CALU 1027 TaxID=317619 RepID=A0A0M2PVZ1_PROHO|nr:F0F1 ATP synthase subunit B [Prochlorothrix hollandica]KKI98818.1 ATP synthase F0F1 subunit B [Prochlorothrix hollandica PCC 9006 = CALU 1027]
MDILGLLATAAEVEERGFGLNADILETNVINLAIIVALLVYGGRNFLGNILSERKTAIEEELREVEQNNEAAKVALATQQEKLSQAEAEAAALLATAQDNAKTVRDSIVAQAVRDVERMKASAAQDLEADRERVILQLRQRVVALALQQAETTAIQQLDGSAQQKLIDRSLAMLGGR